MGEEAGQEVERERGEARQISTLATLLFCQRNAPTQDGGYNAEFQFLWSALGATAAPSAGDRIGMDFTCDIQGPDGGALFQSGLWASPLELGSSQDAWPNLAPRSAVAAPTLRASRLRVDNVDSGASRAHFFHDGRLHLDSKSRAIAGTEDVGSPVARCVGWSPT
jgi:hypothetical protein